MKFTKRDVMKQVLFHGFDGKCYLARINRVRRGIVEIDYNVTVQGIRRNVTACVERKDHARLGMPDWSGAVHYA